MRWIGVLLVLPHLVFAHPGELDSRGCHWDNAAGDEHCHIGLEPEFRLHYPRTSREDRVELSTLPVPAIDFQRLRADTTSQPDGGRDEDHDLLLASSLALRRGDADEALQLALQALKRRPKDALAHRLTASAYYVLENYLAAHRHLCACLELARTDGQIEILTRHAAALEQVIRRRGLQTAWTIPPADDSDLQRKFEAAMDLHLRDRQLEAHRLIMGVRSSTTTAAQAALSEKPSTHCRVHSHR